MSRIRKDICEVCKTLKDTQHKARINAHWHEISYVVKLDIFHNSETQTDLRKVCLEGRVISYSSNASVLSAKEHYQPAICFHGPLCQFTITCIHYIINTSIYKYEVKRCLHVHVHSISCVSTAKPVLSASCKSRETWGKDKVRTSILTKVNYV